MQALFSLEGDRSLAFIIGRNLSIIRYVEKIMVHREILPLDKKPIDWGTIFLCVFPGLAIPGFALFR